MAATIHFPPFRLDPESGQLWRREDPIPLRPKTFAVLRHLVARSGQLVSRRELLEAVWPETHVSDVVLTVCIRELRGALGDETRPPAFIETLHRRGYRFIAKLARQDGGGEPLSQPEIRIVGRDAELETLAACLEGALGGSRQIVFVSGEAGIGKTTLVEAFLAGRRARADGEPWIGRGQCVEQHGTAEPFLPVLEALGRLCRVAGGALVPLLRDNAPSWLLHLPGLLAASEREVLRREHAGSGRERMLRELAIGLERVTAVKPLVLVLEDLHWSDYSTIDLMLALARRREPARLLVVASYRPGDARAGELPLPAIVSELRSRGLVREIALGRLEPAAARDYLTGRLGGSSLRDDLVALVWQQTEGNPLFLVTAVDHLLARGLLRAGEDMVRADLREIASAIPGSLEEIIRAQLDRLGADQRRTLEVAALIGVEFSAPEVAAGLAEEVESVETRLGGLAQAGQLVRAVGEGRWPDGTGAAHYALSHVLYRDVLVSDLGPARRRRLHLRIGERLEAGYGERAFEVASELARHFDHGEDAARAIPYYQMAGERAAERHAYQTAIGHLDRALALLESLPAGSERRRLEVALRTALGPSLLAAKGFGAPEVRQTYERALEICEGASEAFPILAGLQAYHSIAGELPAAHAISRRMAEIAEQAADPVMRLEAHHALGCDLVRLADFRAARAHLLRAIGLYDPDRAGDAYRWTGHDPKTCCLANLSIAFFHAGAPDRALRHAEEARLWSEELRSPFSRAQALMNLGWIHLLRGESARAGAHIEAAIDLAGRHDLPYLLAMATMLGGWAAAAEGDLPLGRRLLEEGFAVCQLMGPRVGEVEHRGLVARVETLGDDARAGVARVAEALAIARERSEHYLEASLLCMRGEVLARNAIERGRGAPDAEAALSEALEAARRQRCPAFELRSALALAALLEVQGRAREGLSLLERACAGFEDGSTAADPVAAARLMDRLAAAPARLASTASEPR